MKKYLPIGIILGVSFLTHFLFFGHPASTVFDEVHFGKFVSGYFTHEYFFDIHPPLGKLIISGMAAISGFEPGFQFANIGDPFPDSSYVWLRLLPMLAGTLLPVIIYWLVKELKLSTSAALIAGIAVALENALLVQSRFILLDAFLLLFGFSAFLSYLRYRNTHDARYLTAAFILAALAGSVKWTGLSFLGIIGIAEFVALFKQTSQEKVIRLISVSLLAFVVYFSLFAVHFALLTKSGPGNGFMSAPFKKTLEGTAEYSNPDIRPYGLIRKFTELNAQMYISNKNLTAGHPDASSWYQWPFMSKPVFYWSKAEPFTGDSPQLTSRIYLIGNPVVWLLSTLSMLYLIIWLVIEGPVARKEKRTLPKLPLLLLAVYLANLLPFVGISRSMFLYHYFPAYIIAIISMAYLFDQLKNKKRFAIAFSVLALIGFVFIAPLSYGLPLTESQHQARYWHNALQKRIQNVF